MRYCLDLFADVVCRPIYLFLELINIISEIINSRRGDRSLSAKTFFHIITAAVKQVDLNANPLFDFFKNIFSDIRYVHQLQV